MVSRLNVHTRGELKNSLMIELCDKLGKYIRLRNYCHWLAANCGCECDLLAREMMLGLMGRLGSEIHPIAQPVDKTINYKSFFMEIQLLN